MQCEQSMILARAMMARLPAGFASRALYVLSMLATGDDIADAIMLLSGGGTAFPTRRLLWTVFRPSRNVKVLGKPCSAAKCAVLKLKMWSLSIMTGIGGLKLVSVGQWPGPASNGWSPFVHTEYTF